jgi:hypothetical protein
MLAGPCEEVDDRPIDNERNWDPEFLNAPTAVVEVGPPSKGLDEPDMVPSR